MSTASLIILKQTALELHTLQKKHDELTWALVDMYNEDNQLYKEEVETVLSFYIRSLPVSRIFEQLKIVSKKRDDLTKEIEKIQNLQGDILRLADDKKQILKTLAKVCKKIADATKV